MKLLYGVQGTGNGHVSRARALAPALAAHGIQVNYVFSGREAGRYFDMQAFGAWRAYRGLSFVVEGGQVRLGRSLRQLRLPTFWRDVRALPVTHYDLVLTDFEPISAWAARLAGVPCVHLSHQMALLEPVPQPRGAWANQCLLRGFAPARQRIGLHWHSFGQPLLPPLVQVASAEMPGIDASAEPSAVLVYLPFGPLAEIQRVLAPLQNTHFCVYHPEIAADAETPGRAWRRLSHAGFQRDLRRAQGVICNAGFELPSEALSLGVKLLVKPLQGQFEQQANAMALAQLNLGQWAKQLDTAVIANWLATAPAEPVQYPDVAQAVAAWLAQGASGSVPALSQRLWRQVQFPAYVQQPSASP